MIADDRPTRMEVDRDDCEHDHQSKDTRVVWVCDDCGQVCEDAEEWRGIDDDDEPDDRPVQTVDVQDRL